MDRIKKVRSQSAEGGSGFHFCLLPSAFCLLTSALLLCTQATWAQEATPAKETPTETKAEAPAPLVHGTGSPSALLSTGQAGPLPSAPAASAAKPASAAKLSLEHLRTSTIPCLKGLALCLLLILISRVLRQLLFRRFLRRWDEGARHAIATTVYYVLVALAVVAGVRTAGLDLSVLTVFAGVTGVALGFGCQDIAKNFISGVILLLDRSVHVGDYVTIGTTEGTVTDITIRCTTLRTPEGRSVIVPNATLVAQQMVNATLEDRRVRLLLEIAVVPESAPDAVVEALGKAAAGHPLVLEDPPPRTWMSKFSATALTFQMVLWTEALEAQQQILGELTTAVWRELKEREIGVA